MKTRDVLAATALLIIGMMVGKVISRGDALGTGAVDTVSVVRDSVRDTVFVEVRDTVPVVKQERVVCYVPVDCVQVCTARDLDSVAVVQREYSDDSTYTAWVSGVRYDVWPRLDSISVRQREVVKTVLETVTLVEMRKARRLSVGVVGGYGYGLGCGGLEPFVGVGVTYRLFPP